MDINATVSFFEKEQIKLSSDGKQQFIKDLLEKVNEQLSNIADDATIICGAKLVVITFNTD